MVCTWGWSWGGVITFMSTWTLAHIRHATLWDLLLHLHTYVMLRSGIFSCTCTHTSCYAVGSSLALAHIRHATLWDLLLHLHTHVMLRSGIFSCTSTHTNGTKKWLLNITILKLHVNGSFSLSKWDTTSDAFINSWTQKLVSDIRNYTSGKTKTNVSLQTYVKLNNEDCKTACNWLFQIHSKTNEPK